MLASTLWLRWAERDATVLKRELVRLSGSRHAGLETWCVYINSCDRDVNRLSPR